VLFRNHTDQAPAISQSFHPKELEYDFNDVYEDGAHVESETEHPEDADKSSVTSRNRPAVV